MGSMKSVTNYMMVSYTQAQLQNENIVNFWSGQMNELQRDLDLYTNSNRSGYKFENSYESSEDSEVYSNKTTFTTTQMENLMHKVEGLAHIFIQEF